MASRHGRAYRGFFRLLESVGVKDARARWERKSPFLQRAVPPLAIAAVVLVLVLPFRTPDPAANSHRRPRQAAYGREGRPELTGHSHPW